MDFALNHKTVSGLGYAALLDLAAGLGCVGVEPRNDLGRPLFDGIAPTRAGDMARERGLRLVGLSEVYPFDVWDGERRDAVSRLVEAAAQAGAETVSLIPRVDFRDPDAEARAAGLLATVAEISSVVEGTGVVALVEPIGFAGCSVRFQHEAIEATGAGDRMGIVHDTFQHALAGDRDFLVGHIRLVHLSGVPAAAGELTDAMDASRVLVDDGDRTDAAGQVQRLLAAGYHGPFSFECTDPALRERKDIGALLAASMEHLVRRSSGDGSTET